MNLKRVKQKLQDLFSVSKEEFLEKPIELKSTFSENSTTIKMVDFLKLNTKPKHIYTKELNKYGVVIQDEAEKYLDNDSLSSIVLKAALKTPLHFEHAKKENKKNTGVVKKQESHFNLGKFLHQAILEPAKFNRVVVEPKYSLATTKGVNSLIDFYETEIGKQVSEVCKEIAIDDLLHNCKKIIKNQGLSLDKIEGKRAYLSELKKCVEFEAVSEEHYMKIQMLKKQYDSYGGGILKRLLHHSKREISMYYQEPITGLDLKIRPDAIQFEENIGVNAIISVKSAATEDLNAFYYQAAKYHYDLSEGMCQEIATAVTGRDFNTTVTVMFQTVEPYAIAVLVWSVDDIERGKHKFYCALNNAKNMIEKGSSKGYDVLSKEESFGLLPMNLPIWNQQTISPLFIS